MQLINNIFKSLITVLVLLWVGNVSAQDFTFKNPNTGMYELHESEINQMYKDYDELRLLKAEVMSFYKKTDKLVHIATEQKNVIKQQEDQIDNYFSIIDKKDEQILLYKDIEDNCSLVYEAYDNKINTLEWELVKVKATNQYLRWGGSFTIGIISAVLVREFLR